MAELIYSAISSLDGFVADQKGNFGWAAPDDEVHAFVNDLERPLGTYLYGRKMYETMVAWETLDVNEPVVADYAQIWRAADKIVFSRSLRAPASARTQIERSFQPARIRSLKEESARNISIGGPHLAAEAIRAGLVDEYHLFLSPVVIGRGNAALPDGLRIDLDLIQERRFGNGVVFLRYRTADRRS